MGSFSIWHWLVIAVVVVLPILFIVKGPPPGPNRFGDVPPPLGFGDAIGSFFSNYFTFSGRASRSAFWYAWLFSFGVSLILLVIDPSETLGNVFSLAVLVPSLSVACRRLHDINRSGWLQLLGLLFPIGSIAVLIWYCTKASDDTAPAPSRTAPDKPATMVNLDVLERLAKLRDSGAISEEEYEAEKRKIFRT